MVDLALRLGEMDFAERVGLVAQGFGETVLRALDALGPTRAFRQAEFWCAAESSDGGVRSVNSYAHFPVCFGTSDGTRSGICMVDFAGPERRHEQDEGDTQPEQKEPE